MHRALRGAVVRTGAGQLSGCVAGGNGQDDGAEYQRGELANQGQYREATCRSRDHELTLARLTR